MSSPRVGLSASCPVTFIATPIDMLCSNFVKCGTRENGKVVRYLPDKKFAWLSSSRYCADRVKICQGQPLTMHSEWFRRQSALEYKWRPLFNAAVWLTPTTRVPHRNAAKTRNPLKFAGVPQTRQQISAVSRPKFTILWRRVKEVSMFNKFFSDCP